MNKKTIVILSLSLLTFSLFSQVQWKELDTRDGLVYAPGYTGDPMSDKNPAFDNPDFKQSISKYDPTTVGGSKKIREAKQQLIKAEKTKVLKMYSLSHYENVRRSISVNYY